MKRLFTFLFLIFTTTTYGQDLISARKRLDTLTSVTLWGRGYTKNGMEKTAAYLSAEFKRIGLQPMDNSSYTQNFNYPVNTFPGKMDVRLNGKPLLPGKDFIIVPSSTGLKAKVKLEQLDSVTFISKAHKLIVLSQDKLTWGTSQKVEDFTAIQLKKGNLTSIPDSIDLDIENTLIPEFQASNICGLVKGTRYPDSVLVFTAHYDHLGGMGDHTYFPGANDNASGITLLLSLAEYYASHPQPYSLAFICFAGEEAGLVGSAYFTTHPLLPLSKIRFLINMDMVGTGEKGITVVNATLHPKEFTLLKQLNTAHQYLSAINSRGPAPNSDHFNFTQKDVPAFFIYTLGGISAYHDVDDIAATLPLTKFKALYRLFIGFSKKLMK